MCYVMSRIGRKDKRHFFSNAVFFNASRSSKKTAALARERGDRSLELAALIAEATMRSVPTPLFDPVRGQALNEQSIALALELGDRAAEAKSYWNLMTLNIFGAGQPQQSVGFGERSLELARALNAREQMAYTLTDLYLAYFSVGDRGRAQAALAEARDLWRELGNLPMLGDALARTAHSYFCAGNAEQTIAFSEEAMRVGVVAHNPWQEANSRQLVTYIYLDSGDIDKAIILNREMIGAADRAGAIPVQVGGRIHLGLIYARLGDLSRGRALAVEATAKADPVPPMHAWAHAAHIRISLLEGRLADAQHHALTIRQGYLELKAGLAVLVPAWAEVAMAIGELEFAAGDPAAVVETMDDLLATLRRFGVRPFTYEAYYQKGLALLALRRIDEAAQSLELGRAAAEALDARRVLWQILMALRDICLLRGQTTDAVTLLRSARRELLFVVEHVTETALRQSFLGRPEVRAVLERA
jgi:tetratricopeptide (TPR) repeat protein